MDAQTVVHPDNGILLSGNRRASTPESMRENSKCVLRSERSQPERLQNCGFQPCALCKRGHRHSEKSVAFRVAEGGGVNMRSTGDFKAVTCSEVCYVSLYFPTEYATT